jgi:type I restriction-modification system DNA methylase subunit
MAIKRSKERIRKTNEIFTPRWLVEEMLDELPESSWEEGKTFIDPTCGDGNFLVIVLERKLNLNHDPVRALNSVFGIDIMEDNIQECRKRLLRVFLKHIDNCKEKPSRDLIKKILKHNIFINDALSFDFDSYQQLKI